MLVEVTHPHHPAAEDLGKVQRGQGQPVLREEPFHTQSDFSQAEDEMVGWYHRLNGHEFEQTLGDNEGQGSLACCSPWGCKESDKTERPNNKQQRQQVEGAQTAWVQVILRGNLGQAP